jgi:hypothetical protein
MRLKRTAHLLVATIPAVERPSPEEIRRVVRALALGRALGLVLLVLRRRDGA